MSKQPGDQIDIGDLLGHPLEPYERWARVTGFLKSEKPTKIIMRCFKDGDGDFPTGEYRTGRLCVPYMPSTEGT